MILKMLEDYIVNGRINTSEIKFKANQLKNTIKKNRQNETREDRQERLLKALLYLHLFDD